MVVTTTHLWMCDANETNYYITLQGVLVTRCIVQRQPTPLFIMCHARFQIWHSCIPWPKLEQVNKMTWMIITHCDHVSLTCWKTAERVQKSLTWNDCFFLVCWDKYSTHSFMMVLSAKVENLMGWSTCLFTRCSSFTDNLTPGVTCVLQ